jgi:hypothetical protein
MQTHEHLLAVVEPTEGGEAALDLAVDVVARGGRATVMVVVTKQARDDFRRFADSEDLSPYDAETIAVDRLADTYNARIGGVEGILTNSVASSSELLRAVTATGATSVAVPQHLATRREMGKLVHNSHVPVLVAPNRAA